MNEDLVRTLHLEIQRLNTELADTRAEARKYRIGKKDLAEQHNKLSEEHAALTTAHAELRRTQADPTAAEQELAALKGSLHAQSHRQAFDTLAQAAHVRDEALDQVFQLSGYQAGEGAPDEALIKTALAALLQTSPWFVRQDAPAEPKPAKLQAGLGLERGNGTFAAETYAVTARQMRDVRWMSEHQQEFAAAGKAGKLLIMAD